ncbi:MAG TPA: hypothetical protein VJP07_10500 [Dehalococcoidia bacterium]|nr:hypothetical protein [Dehalococcoidia bacterium]
MTTSHPPRFTSTGLELADPLPPEEEARQLEELRRFSRDSRLLASMREDLLKEHDGQWTAMYEGRFFHAHGHEELVRALVDAGIDPGLAVRKFLSSSGMILSLRA